MVDARLPDGSRINAVIHPLAIGGPFLTVRKFAKEPLLVEDLVTNGTFTSTFARFIEACVVGRLNVVVSGGTDAGKTTFLNVLSSLIPDDERIVTIEDSKELQLRQEHVVSLESRPPNIEGKGEVSIRDLVRNALRMRPDRIIVGECRGGEALDMLQAMNTGHPGSMTTVHANSPREVLARLETMVLMGGVELPQRAIREQIVMAVGLIVQLLRTVDGRRVISSITEVQGMEGDTVLLQDIFHRVGQADGPGRLVATGLRPKILDELASNGVEVPASLFRTEPDQFAGNPLRSDRTRRPARPGRVELPTEEMYEMLSKRRRDGK
jgi:pilus assembly protein CpaF